VRRLHLPVLLTATALLAAACGGGSSFESGDNDADGASSGDGPVTLRVLIASSGDAETNAVTAAVEAYETDSGNTVDVKLSDDIATDLTKTFATADPYDAMYVEAGTFATWASQDALFPYAEDAEAAPDVYPSLRETFSYDGQFYCLPKDFSTLGLVINQGMWAEAGLTEDDYPTNWDELAAVADQLTTDDHVGLALSPTRDRVGAFMVQAGGWLVSDDGTEATVDSEENVEALTYLQGLMKDGAAAWSSDLDSEWGGAAFGEGKAAMTMEGGWITGAMDDYPDIDWTVAPMPAGPAGDGTLLFSVCWGVAQKSDAQVQAVEFIESIVTPQQQLANAEAFGVTPALESVEQEYADQSPVNAAFISGAENAQGPVSLPGFADVLADFDSQLAGLEDADPAEILGSVQQNAQAAIEDQ